MNNRIKNVKYSERPTPRWKRFVSRIGLVVGVLSFPIFLSMIEDVLGIFYAFIGFLIALVFVLIVSIRREQRRHQKKQRPQVVKRAGFFS